MNQVSGSTSATQDQAEFVTSAASLKRSHFRDVFVHSSMGMAIATPGGGFVEGNEVFCQQVRKTPQEVTRMSIFSVIAPSQLSKAFETLSKWLQGSSAGNSLELASSLATPGLQLHIQKLYGDRPEKDKPHSGLLVSLVQTLREDTERGF